MASFPASSRRCSGSWAPSGSICIWILRESAQGPFSCARDLLPLDRPRCPPRFSGVSGNLASGAWVPQDRTGWRQATSRALTVHARGAQRQEQQEQRGSQEPHAGRRGAAREPGLGEGARRSEGARRGSGAARRHCSLLGALCPERASARLAPAAPVGGCLAAIAARSALRSALGSALAPQPPSARPVLF